MKLVFERLRTEVPRLRTRWDILLRVVADFSISVAGQLIYSEQNFPVVELAAQLQRWMAGAKSNRENLVFTSMESEAEGLVRIEWNGMGWVVVSGEGALVSEYSLGDEDVEAAVTRFLDELAQEVRDRLGLDLPAFLLDEQARLRGH